MSAQFYERRVFDHSTFGHRVELVEIKGAKSSSPKAGAGEAVQVSGATADGEILEPVKAAPKAKRPRVRKPRKKSTKKAASVKGKGAS